jgi:hypothetical protein
MMWRRGRAQGLQAAQPLPHIPLEVSQQIARYLDRKSAYALTLTCKGLRDAGETRLYSLIDLTSGYGAPGTYRFFPRFDLRQEVCHNVKKKLINRS